MDQTNQIPKMKVIYNVSDIASICGYNKYKSTEEVYELIIDYFYKCFKNLKSENNYYSFVDKYHAALKKLDECQISTIKKSILEENLSSSDLLKDNIKEVNDMIKKSDLTKEEKIIINEYISGRNTKQYGTINEDVAIKEYEEKNNVTITDNNEKTYFATFDTFSVCGKIDGMVEKNGEMYIVEIKNRKTVIHRSIPVHEQIQIQYYLYFLPDIKKVLFIQKKDDEMYEVVIQKPNPDIWNDTQERLETITEFINDLSNDSQLRKEIIDNRNIDLFTDTLYWI